MKREDITPQLTLAELTHGALARDHRDELAYCSAPVAQAIWSDGQQWLAVGSNEVISVDPPLAALAFLRKGPIKGIDICAPIDDYEAPSHGLPPARIQALRQAGFNTHRVWLPSEEFLRPAQSLHATVERWVAYIEKSVEAGFRCFIAWGMAYDDVTAIVTQQDMRNQWLEVLTTLCTALTSRFDPSDVALELLNEPPGEELAPGIYREANPLWFRTCRSVAPALTLIFQGEAGYAHTLAHFDLTQFDDNTMFSFHPYTPGEFTHQGIGGQPFLYNVPYPVTRYVGGAEQMIADMSARVNDSQLSAEQKRAEIARYAPIIRYITSDSGNFWEDWTAFVQWIEHVGIDRQRIVAGEFGIVSEHNHNGTPAQPDVATRANWLRKIRGQCDELGFAGWVVHQTTGDFNLFEQIDLLRHGDRLIPELVSALLTDDPLPEGPPIVVDPVPVIRCLTDLVPAAQIVAELDFSDFSRLWQDCAGTQPVTAAGQSVALVKNRYGEEVFRATSDAQRVVLRQVGQAWALDFSGGAFSLLASGFSRGNYLAAAVQFTDDWTWQTPIQCSCVADQNMLVSEADSGRYRSSRTGGQETVFCTSPFDISINGVVDGTFQQHKPHVLGARRTSAHVPDAVCLGSNGGSNGHFQGLIFSLVLLADEPQLWQRRLLDTYVAGKAGLDRYFQPVNEGLPPHDGPEYGVALAGLEFSPAVLPGRAEHDYLPPVERDYRYFSQKGAKVIRFPLLAERLQPQLFGELDVAHLVHLDNAVGWCKRYGMRVLFDIHNYGHRTIDGVSHAIGSPQVPITAHADLMGRLAQRYKDNDGVYGYDVMNEPINMPVPCTPATYHPQRTVVQLVTNPEFARVVPGQPEDGPMIASDWYLSPPLQRHLDFGREGGHGIGFRSISGQWAQARYNHWQGKGLLCKPDTDYVYSFYYRLEADTGSMTAELAVQDESGAPGAAQTVCDVLAPAAHWTRYSGQFRTGPTGTRLLFSVRTDGLTGLCACTGFNITEGQALLPYVDYVAAGEVATTTLMNQAAIDAIRATGSEQWIVIEGDHYSGLQSFTGTYGDNPQKWWHDPLDRTQLSFHYYQDADHSGRYQTPWSQDQRDRIVAEVRPAFDWCMSNGVVINIGEYGVNHEPEHIVDEATFLGLCEQAGAHTFAWAGGRAYVSQTTIQPQEDYTRDRASMTVVQAHLGKQAGRQPS